MLNISLIVILMMSSIHPQTYCDYGYCGIPFNKSNHLYNYNVNFIGSWNNQDIYYILDGIDKVSFVLAKYTGLPPDDSFSCVFGSIDFQTQPYLYGYDSYTINNTILFIPTHVKTKLVVHELAHIFDSRITRDTRPTTLLSNKGIIDSTGDKVTGTWFNGYYRYLGKTAPYNGYLSDSFIDGYQMHPLSIPNGNTVSEDFADIFLNWIYGTFADNKAGYAINHWVDTNMVNWLWKCNKFKDKYKDY